MVVCCCCISLSLCATVRSNSMQRGCCPLLPASCYRLMLLLKSNAQSGGGMNVIAGGQPLTVAVGMEARIKCPAQSADGVPSSVSWLRTDGSPMPTTHRVDDSGLLIIQNLTRGDAGLYTCTLMTGESASGVGSKLNVSLIVSDFVPSFDGNAYLELTGLPPKAYNEYEIRIYFRPISENGLLFYTVKEDDKSDSEAGDFISLGLSEGHLVYKFDVGTGPVAIKSHLPVAMKRWNTAVMRRNKNEGTLILNDEDEQSGVGSPELSGLGLGKVVYLGGAPDYESVPTAVTPKTGFVGDVSMYVVNGDLVNIAAARQPSAQPGVIVRLADVCEVPFLCQNGGVCVPAHEPLGYSCTCRDGASGDNCERTAGKCIFADGECAAGASCLEKNGDGFSCLCPMNRTGEFCNDKAAVTGNPRFDGNHSYIAYPPPSPRRREFKVSFRLRPRVVDKRALVLYMGALRGGGDFVALVIVDETLQLMLNNTKEVLRVKSDQKLVSDEQFTVAIEWNAGKATLTVNGRSVTEEFGDSADYLHLDSQLFLGGVPPGSTLPGELEDILHYDGCILTPLLINGKERALIDGSVDAVNIVQCHSVDACAAQPCVSGATCLDNGDGTFKCMCPEGVDECQASQADLCEPNPCENKGVCRIVSDGADQVDKFYCDCLISFGGEDCKSFLPVEKHAYFNSRSYVAFTSDHAPHDSSETEEAFSMNLRTEKDDGLVLWHGAKRGINPNDQDYMSIGVKDGFLEFAYELGGGPLVLKSTNRVNDNKKHYVKVWRQGRSGILTVDDQETSGASSGILAMLNANGEIYVGGMPGDTFALTRQTYRRNFTGCIGDLRLPKLTRTMDFAEDADHGYNVIPCDDWEMRAWRRRMRFWLL